MLIPAETDPFTESVDAAADRIFIKITYKIYKKQFDVL